MHFSTSFVAIALTASGALAAPQLAPRSGVPVYDPATWNPNAGNPICGWNFGVPSAQKLNEGATLIQLSTSWTPNYECQTRCYNSPTCKAWSLLPIGCLHLTKPVLDLPLGAAGKGDYTSRFYDRSCPFYSQQPICGREAALDFAGKNEIFARYGGGLPIKSISEAECKAVCKGHDCMAVTYDPATKTCQTWAATAFMIPNKAWTTPVTDPANKAIWYDWNC